MASHRPGPWTHGGHTHAYAAPSSRLRDSAPFFSRDEDEDDDDDAEDEEAEAGFFDGAVLGPSPVVLASADQPLTAYGFSQHAHDSV